MELATKAQCLVECSALTHRLLVVDYINYIIFYINLHYITYVQMSPDFYK